MGAPFFFRLKAPRNVIGGFGFFSHFEKMEAWRAWQVFDDLNGAPDLPTMLRRLVGYRQQSGDPAAARTGDFVIGCIVVSQPTFFTPDEWVRDDSHWKANIVSGKGIDVLSGEGQRILNECFERLRARADAAGGSHGSGSAMHPGTPALTPEILIAADAARHGKPILVRPRLGQGTFRLSVVDAYGRACAVTNEHSLPVLEAAHVQPFAQGGPHDVSNGLLLRSDVHRLFDLGYVTVTPEYRFRVSPRLMDDFHNGREYERFEGRTIHTPRSAPLQPDRDLLDWHGQVVFRG